MGSHWDSDGGLGIFGNRISGLPERLGNHS